MALRMDLFIGLLVEEMILREPYMLSISEDQSNLDQISHCLHFCVVTTISG
jgi:hypothetical protein